MSSQLVYLGCSPLYDVIFLFMLFFIPFFVKLQRKKYNQLVEWHTATTSSSSGSFLHMIEWGFGVCMYMCVSSSAMLPGANLTFQSTLRGSSLSSGIFRPVIVISQQKDKTYSPYWLCYKKAPASVTYFIVIFSPIYSGMTARVTQDSKIFRRDAVIN